MSGRAVTSALAPCSAVTGMSYWRVFVRLVLCTRHHVVVFGLALSTVIMHSYIKAAGSLVGHCLIKIKQAVFHHPPEAALHQRGY